MGFLDFVKKQFIDIIQWTEDGDEVLAWRFPMRDMEIQQGAQLTVRETQSALFVHQGKPADLFGPGQHTIKTQNIPLLTDLANWDKLFESPFKSDVYFFSTRLRLNQKWGTSNPITLRDREFGAVRYRTTQLFERIFGLESLSELPRLDDVGEDMIQIRERLETVAERRGA